MLKCYSPTWISPDLPEVNVRLPANTAIFRRTMLWVFASIVAGIIAHRIVSYVMPSGQCTEWHYPDPDVERMCEKANLWRNVTIWSAAAVTAAVVALVGTLLASLRRAWARRRANRCH
jgi:hypothetical protein